MLRGELSGVASEHTKTFSFLFFCNLVWCQGILIGSSTSTEALDCDSKKEKKHTTYQRTELFHDRDCPVKWQFDLETIEKRRHQRKYDNTAYLPCVWLFNHGQLSDTDGWTANVLGSQRDPPYNLRVTVVFIRPCLWWLCSINSIIFQGVRMS